ncbi:benzoylformate decarboxylase, partial [Pseudomonas aeruginosa]
MRTVHSATYKRLRPHGLTTVSGNPGYNALTFIRDFREDVSYRLGLHAGAVVGMAYVFALAICRWACDNL